MHDAQRAEVDANYEAFKKMLPNLMPRHKGRWALMRRGECVEAFDTLRDAHLVGKRLYEDGIFSIQKVTNIVGDQGWFSYAGR